MADVYTPDTLKELSDSSPRYGVIGYPVKHSLSPGMQLAGFEAAGIEAQYVRIEIEPDKLTDTITQMKEMPFAGWNCTLPHKIELKALVDDLTESAEKLGAVNTVLHEDGRFVGFNTDGQGWVRAIREDFSVDVRDLRILILGAGGAGQALARQAAMEKCERLVIANRSIDKAAELLDELSSTIHSDKLLRSNDRLKAIPLDADAVAAEVGEIDLVVNTTSVGLKAADPELLPARALEPHLLVYDTIYKPNPTRLLRTAEEIGARTSNGLSMLLHQGALSWEIWAGRSAPLEAMRQGLQDAFNQSR